MTESGPECRNCQETLGEPSTAHCGKWGGDLKATVIPDRKRQTLHKMVREQVEEGASVYTDALDSYTGLADDYDHGIVDHAVRYVIGRVHVNSVENFGTLLKRGLKGTYVQVAPSHLFRYVDERVFTYNKRDLDDFGRFVAVLGQVTGRRLTYAGLTDKT